ARMVCLPTGAVVGASCVLFYQSGGRSRHPRVPSTGKASILSCEFLLFSRTNSRALGNFSANGQNYDVVMVVNLSGVTLPSPSIDLGTSALSASNLRTLQLGGLATNSNYGGTGSYVNIMGLPANAIWATLVPVNSTRTSTDYVNASVG